MSLNILKHGKCRTGAQQQPSGAPESIQPLSSGRAQDKNCATRTFLEEAFGKTKWVTLSSDGYVIAQHNNFSVKIGFLG